MGNCAWFGSGSGDWSYREREREIRERERCCAVWRRTRTEEGELQCACPHRTKRGNWQ